MRKSGSMGILTPFTVSILLFGANIGKAVGKRRSLDLNVLQYVQALHSRSSPALEDLSSAAVTQSGVNGIVNGSHNSGLIFAALKLSQLHSSLCYPFGHSLRKRYGIFLVLDLYRTNAVFKSVCHKINPFSLK
nr:MAG TPA: hypothetical protein [Caudoviricetes sp.]